MLVRLPPPAAQQAGASAPGRAGPYQRPSAATPLSGGDGVGMTTAELATRQEILNAQQVDTQTGPGKVRYHREIDRSVTDYVTHCEIIRNLHLGRSEDTANNGYTLVVAATDVGYLNQALQGIAVAQLPLENGDVSPESLCQDGQQLLHQALLRMDAELRRGGKVLVCCRTGTKRSAVVVMAYLRARFNVPRDRVRKLLDFVQSRRVSADLTGDAYWSFLADEFQADHVRQLLLEQQHRT